MWYILDENNNPIKTDIKSYIDWEIKNEPKKALKQEYINDIYVSTVFLGLDHSFQSQIPLLWETMIFGGRHDQYQTRYSSYEDAIKGHEVAVNLVKNKKDIFKLNQ